MAHGGVIQGMSWDTSGGRTAAFVAGVAEQGK